MSKINNKSTRKSVVAAAKEYNVSLAGTKEMPLAELRSFVLWAIGQREMGTEGGLNIRVFHKAQAAMPEKVNPTPPKGLPPTKGLPEPVVLVSGPGTAADVASKVAGFVALFSQGLGIAVPQEMAKDTETALVAAGYVVAKKELTTGRVKFAAAGGGRRSRGQYEEVVKALWEAGDKQDDSRHAYISRPVYLAVVGNTRDFLGCGWSASAGNGLVKAVRRMGYTAVFQKGNTKAEDNLILSAPKAATAS